MSIDFDNAFYELTGYNCFPWQKRMYENLSNGMIPKQCNIPTGLGKTSVIALWLLALVGGKSTIKLPHRLVYVVNRRTIVDQSTDVVMRIRKKISEASDDPDSKLFQVADSLRCLSTMGFESRELFSVSTLRGELADNLEWRFDPLRPAIVIGTVDMIGSKLLFSGYGDTRRTRPLNAGLLGCDTLIVHDEAHLTPAFSGLLHKLSNFNPKKNELSATPSLKVIELSATNRDDAKDSFRIDGSDKSNDTVKYRLYAKKRLCLHQIENNKKDFLEKLTDLAFVHREGKERIIIFIQSPENATEIQKALYKKLIDEAEERWKKDNSPEKIPKKTKALIQEKCQSSISILTGEIRGHERDLLLETSGMLPFTGKRTPDQTVYLVSTSAGEVGMDLHADHMVSDLSTFDSMIQRLGRVNRFGKGKARVDVVHEPSIKDEPRNKTLELFKAQINTDEPDNGIDVSPTALTQMMKTDIAGSAFSHIPEMVDATDILLDLWTQTSLADIPARPEIAPWLHGIQENLPETWMAWRMEIPLLANKDIENEEIARWFQKCRISSRETLRRPTYKLKWNSPSEKKWVENNKNQPVILLTAKGMAIRMTISELSEKNVNLNFATIIFPLRIGGLNEKGFFDIEAQTPVSDVSDESLTKVVLERIGGSCYFKLIEEYQRSEINDELLNLSNMHPWRSLRHAIREIESSYSQKAVYRMKVLQASEWDDEENLRERWLILLKEKPNKATKAAVDITVVEHNQNVADIIVMMTKKLSLPDYIGEALYLAAKYHDTGKSLDRWQFAAGFNTAEPAFEPRAKPISGGVDWRKLDGYRHELGSVMNALETEEVKSHPESDLILHLIATHHGWARPHFEERAFPPEVDDQKRQEINLGIMMRFISLQERFGYFYLAWLESLLRRADGMASARHGINEETSDE